MKKVTALFAMVIFSFAALANTMHDRTDSYLWAKDLKVTHIVYGDADEMKNISLAVYFTEGIGSTPTIMNIRWDNYVDGVRIEPTDLTLPIEKSNSKKNIYWGHIANKDDQGHTLARTSVRVEEELSTGVAGVVRFWKISIRRGFGWCGTGDQVINLEGLAWPVFI